MSRAPGPGARLSTETGISSGVTPCGRVLDLSPQATVERRTSAGEVQKGPSGRPSTSGMQLHTAERACRHLTIGRRDAFLSRNRAGRPRNAHLRMTLVFVGCCLSEALELTGDRVDFAAGVLVFEGLTTFRMWTGALGLGRVPMAQKGVRCRQSRLAFISRASAGRSARRR